MSSDSDLSNHYLICVWCKIRGVKSKIFPNSSSFYCKTKYPTEIICFIGSDKMIKFNAYFTTEWDSLAVGRWIDLVITAVGCCLPQAIENPSSVLKLMTFILKTKFAIWSYHFASAFIVRIFSVGRLLRNGNSLEPKQFVTVVHSQNRNRLEIGFRYSGNQ